MVENGNTTQSGSDASNCPAAGAIPPPVATQLCPPFGLDDRDLNITKFLRGSCILVTGVTGFCGTMLVGHKSHREPSDLCPCQATCDLNLPIWCG